MCLPKCAGVALGLQPVRVAYLPARRGGARRSGVPSATLAAWVAFESAATAAAYRMSPECW
jgi:hypothetical protein